MTLAIDKKAETQWKKSCVSYENYQAYIKGKQSDKRYDLTLIDLLYISNFKGGNATINEPENEIKAKLKSYSKKLANIKTNFEETKLADLTTENMQDLKKSILDICNMTQKNKGTRIDGFGVSYLSALLHAYFPKLIPILDRRVLINLGLVTNKHINKQGQIKNIQTFYEGLIDEIAKICQATKKEVREIDRDLFVIRIKKTTTGVT